MKRIDLNSDMGELPEAVADGSQQALLRFVTSANIACGGHAGTSEMMKQTIEQALAANVAIGAHPGYEDRENMGRAEQNLTAGEIAALVYRQLLSLQKTADRCGAQIRHVKPHGALYNQAARDPQFARGIADGVAQWCDQCRINKQEIVLVGLAGSVMLESFRAAGFQVAAEAFADRRYEPDGTLRARRYPDALITDPALAAQQVIKFVEDQRAQTICIHGDTAGAHEIAAEVSRTLREYGIAMQPL